MRLLAPRDRQVARAVTDTFDEAVRELGEGLTTSDVVNRLRAKRDAHLEAADNKHRTADKKAGQAHNWHDKVVSGAGRRLGEMLDEADDIRHEGDKEAAHASKLGEMESILRTGR